MWMRALWTKFAHFIELDVPASAEYLDAICGWSHKASDMRPDPEAMHKCASCNRYLRKKGTA